MRNLSRNCVCITALVLLALLLTANRTNAQPLTFGVKVGINATSLPNAGEILDPVVKQGSVETSSKLGGTFGAFLVAPIKDRFSFEPELMFVAKGVKLKEAANNGTVTANIRYLEFPMLIRYAASAGAHPVYLMIGPTFGVKASTSAHLDGPSQSSDINIDTAVRSLDAGIAFAGGVEYNRYLFEVRYTQGVNDIGSDAISHTDSARNRVFAVLAGIRFN